MIIDASGKRFEVRPLVELDPVELDAGRVVRRGEIIEGEYSVDGVRPGEVSVFDLMRWHQRRQGR